MKTNLLFQLENKDLIAQVKGFVSKVNHFNNKKLLLEHFTEEAADHGKAFPMTVVKSMNCCKQN